MDNNPNYNDLYTMFMKGRRRGPETSKLMNVGMRIVMGFHRLAINGLNTNSDQPIHDGDIHLICNGEIYNYRELYALMGVEPKTQSDCEVILHLYKRYGMKQTLSMLDGVFAFVLLDQSVTIDHPLIYMARDPLGVRPLYTTYQSHHSKSMFMVGSELKMLYTSKTPDIVPRHFAPGTFSEFYLTSGVSPSWICRQNEAAYYTLGITPVSYPSLDATMFARPHILNKIRTTLVRAVEKRCQCTERPVACLLSGGLDSSLVTAIVTNYREKNGLSPVETFSIGLEGSEDLKYAKIVATHLGTNHTEIVVSETDFLEAIPEVIYAIESYDTTTVRASIGNYLLGKYISEHSDAKVILNGDGSDELMGGYLYMHACPDALAYDAETRRLLQEIHAFDVLRSDKCISSHGLEPRTPFLDREFVQMYLSIPYEIRYGLSGRIEKSLVREAFSEMKLPNGDPLLPDTILWRKKEAFSDGVSKHSRSLFEIIQEHTNRIQPDNQKHIWRNAQNPPKTSEQLYYRALFESYYPRANVLPHFWMPKFVDATDASARTLSLYKQKMQEDNDKHVTFIDPLDNV
jgi:asparagine synthase (glutamine-hydrolysing)